MAGDEDPRAWDPIDSVTTIHDRTDDLWCENADLKADVRELRAALADAQNRLETAEGLSNPIAATAIAHVNVNRQAVEDALEVADRVVMDRIGLGLRDIQLMDPEESKKFKARGRLAAERNVLLGALLPPAIRKGGPSLEDMTIAVLADYSRIGVFDPNLEEPGITVLLGDQSKELSRIERVLNVIRRLDLLTNAQHEPGCYLNVDPSDNCICIRREAELLREEFEEILGRDS